MPRAKLDDVELYYEVKGDGVPLVLINGYSRNSDKWNQFHPIIHTLSETYQVIRLDNRGTGRSSTPSGEYSIPTMADDVTNLLTHLELSKANLLGVSMGGMIAQEVALRSPEKVDKLVLVCSSPGGDIFDRPYQKEALEKLTWEYSPPDGMKVEEIYETLFGLVVYPDFFEANRVSLMSSYSDYATSAATLEKQYLGMLKHDTVDRLERIVAETLVIHGDSDKLLFPEGAEWMADKIPNATLLMIENASHYVLDEKRDVLQPKLVEFLGE